VAREQQFESNITALRNLTGDVQIVTKNPIARAVEIILDAIRFPVNPIDNSRNLKEAVKRVARNISFMKDWRLLKEVPEEASTKLSKNPGKAEKQITSSLSQMRRDALPYDGSNRLVNWLVNKYAKQNINMSAKQTLSWFTASNVPFIGFAISAFKLYIPNVIEPFYEKKYIRGAKSFFLTATDFGANVALSLKGGFMIGEAAQLFATHGFLGGLLGIPAFLLLNWEIVTPYPVILAYSPIFIQGRLDKNDYRKYARHMEAIRTMMWQGSEKEHSEVTDGVRGMLKDYAHDHKDQSLQQNTLQMRSLMQTEYTAILERLTDENTAMTRLQDQLNQLSEEHHQQRSKIEHSILKLSLRNKAHKARLLFIENLYMLMQESGHLQ
jgi:hypothetical protein